MWESSGNISNKTHNHFYYVGVCVSFDLDCGLQEIEDRRQVRAQSWQRVAVASCHHDNDVLVNDDFSQFAEELEGVHVLFMSLSLGRHSSCHAQNCEGAVQIFLIEGITAVHAKVSESVEGRKFDFAFVGLVSEDVMQARHEVVEVLVHSFAHAAWQVRDDTARQACALIIVRFERILNIAADLFNFDIFLKSNNHALESDKTIFCHPLGLLEKTYDDFDNIGCKWFFHHVANFDKDNLDEST